MRDPTPNGVSASAAGCRGVTRGPVLSEGLRDEHQTGPLGRCGGGVRCAGCRPARSAPRCLARRCGQDGCPFSRRTLVSAGKAREVADACRARQVQVVVFANPLTEHQRAVLGEMFGCTVISGEDLFTRGG
nr:hypothetical protein [Micromonospora tarapacensis]